MNTKRYAISLSLALALGASTGAQANQESEWSKVISYGNTTIAQDSPDDFGPWKMMVQPAAGPQPIAALSTPSQTSSPRPNINPNPINETGTSRPNINPNPINETGTYRLIDSSSISRSNTCTGKRC